MLGGMRIHWVMAPKKGKGTSKGKLPAKKAQNKRPAIEISESEDEGSMDDQRVIHKQLEALEALERAHGLSPGGLGTQVWVQVQRARWHAMGHNRVFR